MGTALIIKGNKSNGMSIGASVMAYRIKCYDQYCLYNSLNNCTLPTRKAFMSCMKPSKRQIENILKRINKE